MPNQPALEGFARLLPRNFRERVFEPALADLVLTERTEQAHRPSLGAQLALIAACVWVLLLQIAWRQISPRRPLRLARRVVLVLLATWYVLLRTRYGHARLP